MKKFERGFVMWPETVATLIKSSDIESHTVYNTNEGGMECWLIVPDFGGVRSTRNVCLTGFNVSIVTWADMPGIDTLSRKILAAPAQTFKDVLTRALANYEMPGFPVNCAICIGATRETPFYGSGFVWQPTREDLTAEGKALYDFITQLYDTTPLLVMVLDT